MILVDIKIYIKTDRQTAWRSDIHRRLIEIGSLYFGVMSFIW